MVWFFERGMEISTLEVRRRNAQFEVTLTHADGHEEVEVVPTPTELLSRLARVPDTMFVEGWQPIRNHGIH
jgi:predicted glycoside hydrolase/deacetylase ChbG (UPF0249 family)